MKQIKTILLTALFAISLLLPVITQGAEAEKLKEGRGTINYIDLRAGKLVVDDVALTLPPGYKVKNSKGKEISAFNLRQGKKVTILYAPGMVVKEIIIVK